MHQGHGRGCFELSNARLDLGSVVKDRPSDQNRPSKPDSVLHQRWGIELRAKPSSRVIIVKVSLAEESLPVKISEKENPEFFGSRFWRDQIRLRNAGQVG